MAEFYSATVRSTNRFRGPVLLRDSHEAGRWSVATNRKAVGLWSGGKSIPFLKRLVEAERLTMRVETRDGVYTFAFDLSGARAHVEKLAKACNWSL